jgi:hypothetical protein
MRSRTSALLIVAALAASCGSDEEQPEAAPESQRTTSAPSLAGSYERRLTKADIVRTDPMRDEADPNQEKPEPGPLELTLDDGTLAMTDIGAGFTVRQDFSATSDGELRIGAYHDPDQGAFCGPDVSQTAAYTWALAGGVLTLKAKQDECADRDSSLTGEWRRR